YLDDSSLLIAKDRAAEIKAAKASTPAEEPPSTPPQPGTPSDTPPADPSGPAPGTPKAQVVKKRFYGTVDLDPVKAKLDFAQIMDEVVQVFTSRPDAKVSISFEIQAESEAGFDEVLQRAIKENCNVLKFSNAEFDE
nr:hypothetical protein [Deltaproteobacteria bacterium]